MTLTQILQKLKSVFYTKSDLDSMGGGASLDTTIRSKASASDLNNYLSLSGGQMTGIAISRNMSASELQINGGTSCYHGGSFIAYGNDAANELAGCFKILASTDTSSVFGLVGTPAGSLTWGGKNVNVITEYTNTNSTGCIVFGNGFIIAWTSTGGTGRSIVVNKPRPFKTIKCIAPDTSTVIDSLVCHAYNPRLTTNTTDTIYKNVESHEDFDVVWLGQVV